MIRAPDGAGRAARAPASGNAWGKFDRDSGTVHPLAHHCMDVAAVFARMARLPVIRDRLEQAAGAVPVDAHYERLAVCAA